DFRDHVAAASVIDRVRSAERTRERKAVFVVATVQVGLAHPARHDPHQCLVRPRISQFEPIDRERTEFFGHDGGGDFHDSYRGWSVAKSRSPTAGGGGFHPPYFAPTSPLFQPNPPF